MLTRRTPLRRTRFKKKRRKDTDAPEHLKWLREQPCCLGHLFACSGVVESHHTTVSKGMSLRTSDLDAFPFCGKHHRAFHDHAGHFAGWSKDERKSWQLEMSARYRQEIEETG